MNITTALITRSLVTSMIENSPRSKTNSPLRYTVKNATLRVKNNHQIDIENLEFGY